jgi:ribose 5-phosphate isomerase RpiB
MGQRVIGPKLTKMVVDAWLESEFGGLVGEEVRKMEEVDRQYHGAA